MLNEPLAEVNESEFDHFIGPDIEEQLSRKIATGVVDPITKDEIILPFLKNTGGSLSSQVQARRNISTPVMGSNVGKAFNAITARRTATSPATIGIKPATSFFTPTRRLSNRRQLPVEMKIVPADFKRSSSSTVNHTTSKSQSLPARPITDTAVRPTPGRVLKEKSVNMLTPSIVSKRMHHFIDSESDDDEFEKETSKFFKDKSTAVTTPVTSAKKKFIFSPDSSSSIDEDSSPESKRARIASVFRSPTKVKEMRTPVFRTISSQSKASKSPILSLDQFIYSGK